MDNFLKIIYLTDRLASDLFEITIVLKWKPSINSGEETEFSRKFKRHNWCYLFMLRYTKFIFLFDLVYEMYKMLIRETFHGARLLLQSTLLQDII